MGRTAGRRPAGLLDRFGGSGQAGTRQHRNPPGHGFDRTAQQLVIFVIGQGRGLAGRTGHHHPVNTTLQLQVQQALPTVGIQCAVRLEGRRQRGDETGKGQGHRARKKGGTGPA
ncbi:hypothetical protein D3C81_1717010 [compost metagenome]